MLTHQNLEDLSQNLTKIRHHAFAILQDIETQIDDDSDAIDMVVLAAARDLRFQADRLARQIGYAQTIREAAERGEATTKTLLDVVCPGQGS